MNYIEHILVLLAIYFLVATSLNLLIGYGGLLQVAHAAFYGVGAYTYALLSLKLGFGFVSAVLMSGIVAGIASLLTSLPAWRFRGDSFLMMSLAAQLVLQALMLNWTALTGGPFGLMNIPPPAIGSITFATTSSVLALFSVIVAVGLGVLILLKRSPFGRSLQAMRDDELAARSLAISTRRLKVEAFAVAAGLVGVAGALYASFVRYIDPTSFNLDASILMFSMVIVGGTGNIRGPFVGALTLIAIPEVLRFMAFPSALAGSVRLLVYGLLLILMMRLRPQGLAGRYRLE